MDHKIQKLLCPCGSEILYSECCGRYHFGVLPENGLALMKSRYVAYQKCLPQYIMDTTHPDNVECKEKKQWFDSITKFCKNTEFLKLEILEFIPGEKEAFVTFKAYLRQNGMSHTFVEKSRFLKINEKWLYREGKVTHLK